MITVKALKAVGLTDAQIAIALKHQDDERRATKREQARIRMQNHRARYALERNTEKEPEKMQKAEQNQGARYAKKRNVTQQVRNIENPNEINSRVTHQLRNGSPHTPLTQNQRIGQSQISREWRPIEMDSVMLADKLGLAGPELDDEVQRFIDYHRARGAERCDWDAAWRSWLQSPFRKGKTNGHEHPENRRQRELSRWERMYAAVDRFTGASDGGQAGAADVVVFPAPARG